MYSTLASESIVKNMDRSNFLWYLSMLAATVVLLSAACVKSWTAVPKPETVNSYEHCSPVSTEDFQMLFVPGYGQTSIIVRSCDKFRRERVSIAMKAFESAWVEKFGEAPAVRKNLRNLLITFDTEPKKVFAAYDMDGNYYEDVTLSGQTFTVGMFWVHTAENVQRICDTSFIHELIHVSIWADGYDRGDPDHLGEEYPGWEHEHSDLLEEVNYSLCVLGI